MFKLMLFNKTDSKETNPPRLACPLLANSWYCICFNAALWEVKTGIVFRNNHEDKGGCSISTLLKIFPGETHLAVARQSPQYNFPARLLVWHWIQYSSSSIIRWGNMSIWLNWWQSIRYAWTADILPWFNDLVHQPPTGWGSCGERKTMRTCQWTEDPSITVVQLDRCAFDVKIYVSLKNVYDRKLASFTLQEMIKRKDFAPCGVQRGTNLNCIGFQHFNLSPLADEQWFLHFFSWKL